MAQRTFTINTDALVALVGATSLGAGKDQHLPIGLHGGGYLLRSLAKFNLDFSGVVSINYARLYLRASSYHIACGASAGLQVKRVTSSWSEGTRGADEVWYGDNAVEWSNQPSSTTSGQATDSSFGRTANVWEYIDITSIVDAWRTGSTNYGVLLQAISEGSTAYATGFYSRESSYDPYILIDYTTNTAPNAPTLNSPATASILGDTTPDLKFTLTDPQSDTMTKYEILIDNNSGFGSPEVDATVNGSFASGVQQTYTPSALNRGETYYWKVRAYDGSLWGNYSSSRYFTINSLPVATLTDPAATGRLAHMVLTPGAGWSGPRMQVSWNYSDAQGQTQNKYELEIALSDTPSASGGNPDSLIVSGEVSSSASTVTPSAIYSNGYYYFVRVRVYDGLEWSNWAGWYEVRARWGVGWYAEDARIGGTTTPNGYSLQDLVTTTPTNTKVEVEYNSGTDAGGSGLGTWRSTLATVSPQDFVYYRAWLFFWGASPATSPSLDSITIRSTGNVAQPDYWLPTPLSSVGASMELDDKVFGTQSLKIEGNSTTRAVEQQLVLEPDRDYVLQGRVRSIGNSGAHIELRDSQGGTTLLSTDSHTADSDWTQDTSAVWNSGSRTVVWVACVVTGAGSTAGLFDGLKMERGVVASPWNPGLVGTATVVDAGGVSIDATAGGIFRVRAADGTVVDEEQVVHGLSPAGSIVAFGGTSAPTGWLMCDGSAVSRTTYADLFAVLGTTYGNGNGSTTFNLPNLQQRFPLGKATSGTGSTLGSTGGNIDHTHTGPSHAHTSAGHTHDLSDAAWAQHEITAGASTITHRYRRIDITNYTPTVNITGVPYTGSGAATATYGIPLDGATDSRTPSNTGNGGTGATGTGNPPYQVVNYIVKT